MWCIPPGQNAEFAARMEDVLDVYAMPHDEKHPAVCIDEKPYQLLDDVRKPLAMRAESPEKIDSEYKRCGTCSIFAAVQPLTGWRRAHARERRTALDYAEEIEFLVNSFPAAEKILLVQDNLNTHAISSLYKAFEPSKARDIARKLELHYTPKHGSWLNIARNHDQRAFQTVHRQAHSRHRKA